MLTGNLSGTAPSAGSVSVQFLYVFATTAQLAKLDGIEAGAQKNPSHVVSFRTLDNNGAIAGATFFIKADNTEWNSGSTNDIAAIEIHHTQLGPKSEPAN